MPRSLWEMSGHSKWASIKHKKAIVDSRRGQQFTKLARAITVAARDGGGDPEGNPTLENAIRKAKEASMPKDNIERAIAKGTGGGEGEASALESVLYEGYGPGGVAVLVEAVTDNRNRTGADVRHAFSKYGGNLGEPGSVAYLFDKKGTIAIDADKHDEDEVMVSGRGGRGGHHCRRGPLGGPRGARRVRVRARGAGVRGRRDRKRRDRLPPVKSGADRRGAGRKADEAGRGVGRKRRRGRGARQLRRPGGGARARCRVDRKSRIECSRHADSCGERRRQHGTKKPAHGSPTKASRRDPVRWAGDAAAGAHAGDSQATG